MEPCRTECNSHLLAFQRRLAAREWRGIKSLRARRQPSPPAAMSSLATLLVLAFASCAYAEPKCTTVYRGTVPTSGDVNTGDVAPGPLVTMAASEKSKSITLSNYCQAKGKEQIGQMVMACDDDVAPTVDVPAGAPYSPVGVTRAGAMADTANVNIMQYCKV